MHSVRKRQHRQVFSFLNRRKTSVKQSEGFGFLQNFLSREEVRVLTVNPAVLINQETGIIPGTVLSRVRPVSYPLENPIECRKAFWK